ncbi:MAG: ABC transporter ATP-binding protein [Phycisphaerae bacterium]|nr:ABC transporter ATP-binding protein [Phycisphaerae bacterium]
MIKLQNIQKRYNTKAGFTYVLQQITLDIAEGEFVTLMGPSGAGKTTLLNIIGMLDSDWEGQYTLDDNSVHTLKPRQRLALNKQYVGFVFQNFNLLDSLTVYENLEAPLSYRNVKGAERASIVCDTLDRFGIVGKKDLFPSQLSGGQQQLVGVARAVVASPKLILADEPTGNLHSAQGQEVMELLTKLNQQGTTIIQVTHSEKYAAYSRRIINLKDGWMDGEVTPRQLPRKDR